MIETSSKSRPSKKTEPPARMTIRTRAGGSQIIQPGKHAEADEHVVTDKTRGNTRKDRSNL